MEIKEQLRELEEKVNLGLREAYRKMVELKKRNNSPLIVSRGGKVTIIPPNEILPTTSAKNPLAMSYLQRIFETDTFIVINKQQAYGF